MFLCRYKAGEARVCEPEELDSVEWLSINEILADEKIPIFTKEALKLADQMR